MHGYYVIYLGSGDDVAVYPGDDFNVVPDDPELDGTARHDALVELVRAIYNTDDAAVIEAVGDALEHRAATGGDVSRRMLDHVLRSATHAIRANGQLRDAIDEWTAATNRG